MKLAGNLKYIFYLGVLALIFVAGRKIFKKGGLIDSFSSDEKRNNQAMDKALQSISIPKNAPPGVLSEQQLRQRINSIYQAFTGMGTNEDLFFRSVQDLNNTDKIKLYKMWGIKTEQFGPIKTFSGTLKDWIEAELAGKDLEKARAIFANLGIW